MIAFIFIVLLVVFVSFYWVKGIDNMKENHPEYKGEDFLDWDSNHTENEF